MTHQGTGVVHDPSVFILFSDEDLDAFARGQAVEFETEHGTVVFTPGHTLGGPDGADYTPSMTLPSHRSPERSRPSAFERVHMGQVVTWKPTPTSESDNHYALSINAAMVGWFNRRNTLAEMEERSSA